MAGRWTSESAWWRRWWTSPARDVIVAAVMTAVTVGGSYGEAHPVQPTDQLVNGHPVPGTPTAAYLLVAVAAVALAFRRRYPVPVLVTSTVAVVGYSMLGNVNGAALLAPTVALYAVASAIGGRRALLWGAATLVALLAATGIGNPFGPTGGGFDVIPALVAIALFGGIAGYNRRAYVASIRARAADDAHRRVGEERLRIARELHDVVAHTMATINVQAAAAAHLLAGSSEADPQVGHPRPGAQAAAPAAAEQALQALQAIKSASKEGLRELRAILDVLRQVDETDPTQPTPGVDQLDVLVAGAQRAGLTAELRRSGQVRRLPKPVDLAAYRIVQEALTNTIRHAGPATATIALHYGPDELRLLVRDTGRGTFDVAGGGGGHGLVGMRERAASVGGILECGPAPDGGFQVSARLPADPPIERPHDAPETLGDAQPSSRLAEGARP